MPYSRNVYRVKVPNRSGFDKSHRNSGTLRCGTLTPLLCDEVIPNSRISLKLNLAAQLPPLVSDTFMNVKLKAEAFFIPLRLCCGSFEDFFCDVPKDFVNTSDMDPAVSSSKFGIPSVSINTVSYDDESALIALLKSYFGPGSLADYLGFRLVLPDDVYDLGTISINPLPFIAYHLVYQEWYRNPRVQKPCFVPGYNINAADLSNGHVFCAIPFDHFVPNTTFSIYSGVDVDSLSSVGLADGVSVFDLRQRNFPLDYFTGSRVSAQQGDESSVELDPSIGDEGGFTIAQIRAANSLQLFRERNNIPSPRLVDQVRARYNANLSDGVAQRPICIGSATYDFASTGVSQTGAVDDGANPFSGVAAQYGRAYGSGSDFIISDFTANEPGYVMVLVSIVPEVTYSSLIDKKFLRYLAPGSIVEMANPILQNVGDQPVRPYELTGIFSSVYSKGVFGYQDRYADFMFIPNSCHGLMLEGESLDSFVLQRFVVGDPAQPGYVELTSDFLQIPTNYLDGVFAVKDEVSGLSAWYDSYLDYKVSMPLAEFSIPSLQDPAYEHGQSVILRRNGQIF